MTLFIRNMVCNRCIMTVKNELERLGLHPKNVSLGEVVLAEDNIAASKLNELDTSLNSFGFERIDDRKARIIETIKKTVIGIIHHPTKAALKLKWSTLLSKEVAHDYSYISSLFSSVEGTTLEQYIIRQKIEKVKELLLYDELNLGEIADRLGYSSIAHLSLQFKKITGLTPSQLKKSRAPGKGRRPLDSVS